MLLHLLGGNRGGSAAAALQLPQIRARFLYQPLAIAFGGQRGGKALPLLQGRAAFLDCSLLCAPQGDPNVSDLSYPARSITQPPSGSAWSGSPQCNEGPSSARGGKRPIRLPCSFPAA
jgi:hypothetical protein